jgi:hypothetical protein
MSEAAVPVRLLFKCSPLPGESLSGLVARVARANHLSNAHPLLAAAGLSMSGHSLIGTPSDDEFGRLAGLLRLTTEELEPHRIRADGERRTFNQSDLRSAHLMPLRRVAPASLQLASYHRAIWHVRPLAFCDETWDILIQSCPNCRARLHWWPTPGIELCQSCSFDLRGAPTMKVSEEDRDPLSLLSGLFSHEATRRAAARARVPSSLHHLSSGELLDFAIVLAGALLPPKTFDLGANRPKRCSTLAEGVRCLIHPEGPFRSWMTASLNTIRPDALLKIRRDTVLTRSPSLLRTVDQLLGERHGIKRLKEMRLAHQQHTLGEAASDLGLERAVLRRVLDIALPLRTPIRGYVRKHQWLAPAELELLKQRFGERVSATSFAHTHGLSQTAVEQLLRAGIIEQNFDPALMAAYEATQLLRTSVAAFERKLDAHVGAQPEEGWVRLSSVLLAVGGRQKPWAQVINSILSGILPAAPCQPTEKRCFLRDLLVPKAGIAEILKHPQSTEHDAQSDLLSRSEAEEHLNCYPRDLSQLSAKGWIAPHPEHPRKFLRSSIELFGREYLTNREISARTGMHYQWIDKLLCQNGIQRARGTFWGRTAVEELLQQAPHSIGPGMNEEFSPTAVCGTAVQIQAGRKRQIMSTQTLAERAGMPLFELAAVEAGARPISERLAVDIAAALNTTRSELLTWPTANRRAVDVLLTRLRRAASPP